MMSLLKRASPGRPAMRQLVGGIYSRRRFSCLMLLLALIGSLVTTHSIAAPVCSAQAVGVVGGWGWENNASCQVCIDTAPVGDGWGWNGERACVLGAAQSLDSAACIDSPPFDDDWGWNGSASCRLSSSNTFASELSISPVAECIDVAPTGDGWGWNSTNSCATVWSVASYPGWTYQTLAPEDLPYRHFTHIMHFAMYPTLAGELSYGDIFTSANADRAVRAAHNANTKIILVVGGEGEGDKFIGATRPSNMSGFVREVIQRMQLHGYDGVSVDWEESVVDSQLISLVKALSAEFSAMSPRPLLTVDVLSNFVSADTAAEMAPYVDAVNIMSYFKPNRIEDEFAFYQSAGLNPGKVVMGIGLFDDADDNSAERVAQKMRYARRMGFKGAELWSTEFADWDGVIFNSYVSHRWQ